LVTFWFSTIYILQDYLPNEGTVLDVCHVYHKSFAAKMEAVFLLNNWYLSTILYDVSFWEAVVFAATAIKITCLTYLSDINLHMKLHVLLTTHLGIIV